MRLNKQVKTVLTAVVAVGATFVAKADLADDLMKQMDAEIAQVKNDPQVKKEVAKKTVESVVESVQAAQKAEDAGTEAVVAAQEVPKVAEANPKVSSSFDVSDRVAERTAEALKANKNEIGSFDHKKKRIVVIGEAEMPIDVKGDKKGDWALKRTMLAKSALLNAKLKLATALGFELTAEEQQHMFNMPATPSAAIGSSETLTVKVEASSDVKVDGAGSNVGTKANFELTAERKQTIGVPETASEPGKAVIKTSSALQFASSHPIMGATVLLQEESMIEGIYKIAVSMVWSEALQKSAVATMCGTPGFKEAKKGKKSLGEWVEFQENPYLLIGPRQYLDNEGVRHFLGISAFPVGRNTVLAQQNKRKAQLDAIATAAFSCLADVETAEAMNNMMNQYSDPNDLDALPTADVQSELNSKVTQKIQGQAINGVGMVFQKEIEHPLFPGGRLYVYCAELNAQGVAAAREMAKQAYLERAKVAYENERYKAIKAKYMAQIEQAKRDGRIAGQKEKIEKYKTDDAARAKARLEKLKAIAAEAKSNKAAAKAKLDQVREEMKAAGVYDKYKKFVEAIDGMCSGDKIDKDDVNVD